MKNLKEAKTKILPSNTRGGKELPSSSTLDSPTILSRLAPSAPAVHSDISRVIDDTTSINGTCDDASTLLDKIVPLDELLHEQCAKAKELETDENYDSPITPSSPSRVEIRKIPNGYVMDGEIAREDLACNDREDVKKLLSKIKEKVVIEIMKYDP